MKERLKNNSLLKKAVLYGRQLRIHPSRTARIHALQRYLKSYRAYSALPQNSAFPATIGDLYPRLFDDTKETHVDPVYFYQNAWCARKVFSSHPAHHYDIGSAVSLVSILSEFTPVTMVDIRPLSVSLPNLSFVKGNITELPFEDKTIFSLSAICVIEHIGLGRYGDPLDSFGSEKAAAELSRVLAPDGDLYITVPVDARNAVFFNAHRTFTRDGILNLFPTLTLIDEAYQYGMSMQDSYDPASGFGTGMYHFKKLAK